MRKRKWDTYIARQGLVLCVFQSRVFSSFRPHILTSLRDDASPVLWLKLMWFVVHLESRTETENEALDKNTVEAEYNLISSRKPRNAKQYVNYWWFKTISTAQNELVYQTESFPSSCPRNQVQLSLQLPHFFTLYWGWSILNNLRHENMKQKKHVIETQWTSTKHKKRIKT